jgi:nucleoside-diphosphate-sugar epimerase
MQIAVTGGTGFVGRYIVRRLVDAGHMCRLWHRPQSDRSGFGSTEHQLEWVSGQLGDSASSLELVGGCDAVVHAALHRPGAGFRGGEGDVVEFCQDNLLGTLQLIEAARTTGVDRFVYVSTCAVHEKILDDRPLDETHPLWPTSHYGAHKAAVEKFVHSYGLGQNYAICGVRPTGVYGLTHPPQNSKWWNLVEQVVRGETVVARHGGKEVHAADVAQAVERLLTADGIHGQVYNCYDRYISDHDIAEIAKRLTGSSSPIEGDATVPRHQIDTAKIQALGMKFGGTTLLEQTVQEIITAMRAADDLTKA